jgi:type II secretory pathway component PulJ
MRKQEYKKGISLIEAIIYAAILGMVVVVMVSWLINVSQAYSAIQHQKEMMATAHTVFSRLSYELSLAESVVLHADEIELTYKDASKRCVAFRNDAIVTGIGSCASMINPESLAVGGATVDSVQFRRFTDGIYTAVQLVMQVRTTVSESNDIVKTFQTSFSLRGAY